MVQNIPGKSFPNSLKTEFFVENSNGTKHSRKSFPNRLKTEFFVENSNGTKHSRKSFPNRLKTEFFVENSNGTKHSRKSFRKRLKSPQVYFSLSNFDLLNDPKMPKPALEPCLLRVSYGLLLHAAFETTKRFSVKYTNVTFFPTVIFPKR